MDAESYPLDDVKKFLEPMVVMKINPNGGKENKKLAEQFEVNSYPRLIMLKPNGEQLHVVKGGLKGKDQFIGGWTTHFWNAYVGASNAKPQDGKVAAQNLFPLVTWFAHSPMGAQAKDAVKQMEGNPDFKTEWEALTKKNEFDTLVAKAPALMKLGKKDDAKAAYKALATDYPDTKEGKDAAAMCKKLGVKLDAPPPVEKK